jgi:hypothetical protein
LRPNEPGHQCTRRSFLRPPLYFGEPMAGQNEAPPRLGPFQKIDCSGTVWLHEQAPFVPRVAKSISIVARGRLVVKISQVRPSEEVTTGPPNPHDSDGDLTSVRNFWRRDRCRQYVRFAPQLFTVAHFP